MAMLGHVERYNHWDLGFSILRHLFKAVSEEFAQGSSLYPQRDLGFEFSLWPGNLVEHT
jgi:hypothetical protein